MSKLWFVELTATAVVIADDESSAYIADRSNERDIFRDMSDPHIQVMREVESNADLVDGWDNDCVPYGGDRNTRIGELLAAESVAVDAATNIVQTNG